MSHTKGKITIELTNFGLVAEWEGGQYIDILDLNGEALDVINVWDSAANLPKIRHYQVRETVEAYLRGE